MKYYITILLISMPLLYAISQNNYYQRFGQTRIYTQEELENLKNVMCFHFYQIGCTNPKIKEIIIDKRTAEDSIISTIKFAYEVDNERSWEDNSYIEAIYSLIGEKLPEFSLKNMGGTKISSNDLIGNTIVLNFWSTSCKPCIKEIPALNNIKTMFQNQVLFFALSNNTSEEVDKFLMKHSFNFTHLINADEYTRKLGLRNIPKTLIINKDGTVVQILECLDLIIDDDSNDTIVGDGDELIREIKKVIQN